MENINSENKMDEKEDREKKYSDTREDLFRRQLSNAENQDRAILTVSTAALGFSLAFIEKIVPLNQAENPILLIISWGLFILAIVTTISSYYFSQWGITIQLNHAEEYYINRKEEYLNKRNLPKIITDYLNFCSGIIFIAAIIVTVVFVMYNMPKGGDDMAKNSKSITKHIDGRPSKVLTDHQAAPINKFRAVEGTKQTRCDSKRPLEKGAPIPNLRPINKPSTVQPNNPNTPSSSNNPNTPSLHDSFYFSSLIYYSPFILLFIFC